ncbi:MAG: hypothetical protein U0Q15_19390 [Kineosporiaceae bacterium]
MATRVSTTAPARTDVDAVPATLAAPPVVRRPARAWALAGVGAGLASAATVVLTSSIDTVYQPGREGDISGVGVALADHVPAMFAFHSVAVAGALLTLVFAAGLHRLLASRLPGSMLPLLAFAGLAGTAVVSILGSGLDTELMVGMASGMKVDDPTAAAYNHWIGTIPWVAVLSGLAGVALFGAARQGAAPRWLGLAGIVLGGLTLLVGTSPLQYLAIVPATLWMLVTSIGLLVGDRADAGAPTTTMAR